MLWKLAANDDRSRETTLLVKLKSGTGCTNVAPWSLAISLCVNRQKFSKNFSVFKIVTYNFKKTTGWVVSDQNYFW